MKSMEAEKTSATQYDSNMLPKNSAWSVEDLNKMDQSVKNMLRLIKEGGDFSAEKAEMYNQKKSELTASIAEFSGMYRSLAESYGELTEKLSSTDFSAELQSCGSSESVSDHTPSMLTPCQKQGQQKTIQAVDFDSFLTSGGGSSDPSLKEGSDSSSFSSTDSEPESFNSNNCSSAPMNGEVKLLRNITNEEDVGFYGMRGKHQISEDGGDFVFKPRASPKYEEMLKAVAKYEEKVRVLTRKLEISDKEIVKLKGKLVESENIYVQAGSLQAQVKSTQNDLKMRESDLEMERGQVVVLQKKVNELETLLSNSNHENQALISELETYKERLKHLDEEIAKLKQEHADEISKSNRLFQGQLDFAWNNIDMLEAELDSGKKQASELQTKISGYAVDILNYEQEVGKLNAALSEVQESFSLERAQLQSAVSSSLVEKKRLEAKLESSDKEIELYKSQNAEMKRLNELQEMNLLNQIELLKAGFVERGELVEVLNNNLDMQKQKYDELMVEKDGYVAQVLKLIAEVGSRDLQIQQLEEQLNQLHSQLEELAATSEGAKKLTSRLKSRVEELEKEVDSQRVAISDMEEMKRDAIRQLCFSIEHYRNRYRELRQVFIGHTHPAILA